MKEFNLEEAINGKAFYLHDNYRGVIKYSVDDLVSSSGNTPLYPYVGYILDDKGFIYKSLAAWDKNGKSNMAYSYNATTMVDDTPPQDNKKETMKKFDLKAALNGEPINANGQKCYVVREVTELLDDQSLRRFVVIFPDSFTNAEIWDEHDLIDDIGMWEEPELTSEQVLEKAYSEDLIVCLENNDGEFFEGVPVAKTKDSRYLVKDCCDFSLIDNEGGVWLKEGAQTTKSDTITVTLPKPFKPKSGDGYYYINEYGVQFTRHYDEDDDSDVGIAENAQCYRTREDAQKWIDFMKGMME